VIQYLYVLVRTDIPFAYQAVQAAHAAIEAARHFLKPNDDHPHLVLLGVANEERLQCAATYIQQAGINLQHFYEEDLGGELTAIATELVSGRARRIFRPFNLLQGVLS
jgi:hypothetical protein